MRWDDSDPLKHTETDQVSWNTFNTYLYTDIFSQYSVKHLTCRTETWQVYRPAPQRASSHDCHSCRWAREVTSHTESRRWPSWAYRCCFWTDWAESSISSVWQQHWEEGRARRQRCTQQGVRYVWNPPYRCSEGCLTRWCCWWWSCFLCMALQRLRWSRRSPKRFWRWEFPWGRSLLNVASSHSGGETGRDMRVLLVWWYCQYFWLMIWIWMCFCWLSL